MLRERDIMTTDVVTVPSQATLRDAAGRDPLAEHTAGEVMTRRVLSIPPTVDVAVAAERMREADVHRVLVMDEDELLGIVSSMELVRAVAEQRLVHRTFVFDGARGERSR